MLKQQISTGATAPKDHGDTRECVPVTGWRRRRHALSLETSHYHGSLDGRAYLGSAWNLASCASRKLKVASSTPLMARGARCGVLFVCGASIDVQRRTTRLCRAFTASVQSRNTYHLISMPGSYQIYGSSRTVLRRSCRCTTSRGQKRRDIYQALPRRAAAAAAAAWPPAAARPGRRHTLQAGACMKDEIWPSSS